MNITGLTISNFLGIAHLQQELTQPCLFVGGDNGAGKSSLMQAIRFGLTGVTPRGVSKVGDRHLLVSDGAKSGFVTVDTTAGTIKRTLPKNQESGNFEAPAHLDLCLEATSFARLDDTARRKLLFAVTGTEVNAKVVAEQLSMANVMPDHIAEICKRLATGFAPAAAYARDRASESRGSWRTITGETYGSTKAETWAAPVVAELPTAQDVADKAMAVTKLSAKVAELQRMVGAQSARPSQERIGDLERLAAGVDAARNAQQSAQSAYDSAAQLAQGLTARSSARRAAPVIHPCPHCGEALTLTNGAIYAAEQVPDEPLPDLSSELGAAKAAAHDAHQALNEASRNLVAAESAASTLSALPPPPTDEELEAPALLNEVIALRRAAEQELDELKRQRAAHAEAASKGMAAMNAHRQAISWKAAEEKLAPEGIPSVLLARALDPVNAMLAEMAAEAGWRIPEVTRDIELSYGGRAYNLVSESEQWRADALFSAAISRLAGVGILMLDRFDVLAPAHRGAVLDWCLWLCDEGYVNSVILAGTLKAAPDLGDGFDLIWLS